MASLAGLSLLSNVDATTKMKIDKTQPNIIKNNAEKTVIEICKHFNVSCGTQLSDFSEKNLNFALEKGYSFIIASSDLFVLNNWAANAESLMRKYRK